MLAPTKAQFIFTQINSINFWNYENLSMFIKNMKKKRLKIKENLWNEFARKKMVASLLKLRLLVTSDLKEGRKIGDLKLFENRSRIKIIWKPEWN